MMAWPEPQMDVRFAQHSGFGSLGGAGFRAWRDLGGIGCSFTTTSFMALGCSLLEFREFRVRQFQV